MFNKSFYSFLFAFLVIISVTLFLIHIIGAQNG